MHFRVKSYSAAAKIIFVLLALLSVQLSGCAERKRSNIFDPRTNIDSLNISLYITRADSSVTLNWYPPSSAGRTGFNLFRRKQGEENFSLLATLAASQFQYTDRETKFDLWHEYYLTVLGKGLESPPTHRIKTIPGPDTFWLLDRWDYNIFHFTYDLKHKLHTQYAVWVPQEMSFARAHQLAMITYPQYGYAEIFDTRSGQIVNSFNSIKYPFACTYVPEKNSFWLCDSSGGIYAIAPFSPEARLLTDSPRRPTQMLVSSTGRVYVLDSGTKSVLAFNLDGQLLPQLSFMPGSGINDPRFMSMSPSGYTLYIVDRQAEVMALYKINLQSNQFSRILETQHMDRARQSAFDGSLWVSANYQSEALLMQLSGDGLRQKTLQGFSHIEDFQISPRTGNLIVADSRAKSLVHVRTDSTLVGRFTEAYYPYRVYIE